jgi:uncharacterized GH25 family protein
LKKYLLLTTIFLLVAAPVLAHKVKVSAYVTSGIIYVEGRYPDDRPVKNARIFVKGSDDELLIKEQADENGRFNFPIPKIDTLKITVGDMLGHRTTVKLRKSVIAAGQD